MRVVNIVSLWENPTKLILSKPIRRFAADMVKDDKKCLLVFASGKIIATGFRSMKDVGKSIKKRYPEAKLIKIVNITATVTLRSRPNIINCPGVVYEPEIFPACVWHQGKHCVVYYSTGKLILTGCKTYKELYQLFSAFRKSINTATTDSKSTETV